MIVPHESNPDMLHLACDIPVFVAMLHWHSQILLWHHAILKCPVDVHFRISQKEGRLGTFHLLFMNTVKPDILLFLLAFILFISAKL